MSPRMWFTLVLRYVGVSEAISALHSFVTAYNIHMGFSSGSTTAAAFVNHGVQEAAVGVVLVLGAAQISAALVKALPQKLKEPESAEPQNM